MRKDIEKTTTVAISKSTKEILNKISIVRQKTLKETLDAIIRKEEAKILESYLLARMIMSNKKYTKQELEALDEKVNKNE